MLINRNRPSVGVLERVYVASHPYTRAQSLSRFPVLRRVLNDEGPQPRAVCAGRNLAADRMEFL